jgi:transposase
MSFQLREGHRVFIFDQAIDFRAGFDKLSMLVREKMKKNLVEGDLFLFLGKNRKRLKALCYDGTGLLLLSKRMERGRFMSVTELEEFEINRDELNLLLSGGMIRRKYFGEKALTNRDSSLISPHHGPPRERTEYRSSQTVHVLASEPSEAVRR